MGLKKLFPSRDMVSVEIGGEFLKLAYLKKTSSGIEVLNLVSKDIRSLSDDDVVTFIQNYLTEHQIATQNTLTFISPRYTVNKNIELPSTNPEEIREIIKLQAGRYTPYSKEEIIIDYMPLGVFKGGYTKVLLVIVNRDIIKKYQNILERTGLRLKKIVLGQEIITHWLQGIRDIQNAPFCVIHFDYGCVDFMVIQNGKATFVRSIPVGGYQLTQDATRYQEKFISEIKSSLESYQIENTEKLNHAVLIGAIDNLDKNIPRILTEQFGLLTEKQTYLDRISFSKQALSAKESETKDASFLTVLNLPLYGLMKGLIDLTPEEIRLREAMAEKSRDIVFTGVLIMFILIISSALIAKKISGRQDILNYLNQTFDSSHQQAVELNKNYKQVKLIKKYLNERTHALESITEMYKLIPDSIYLNTFTLEEEKSLILEGIGESLTGDIQLFVQALEKSPLFKGVDKKKTDRRTIKTEEGKDKDIFEFTIVCPFEKPPPNPFPDTGK